MGIYLPARFEKVVTVAFKWKVDQVALLLHVLLLSKCAKNANVFHGRRNSLFVGYSPYATLLFFMTRTQLLLLKKYLFPR